MGFILFIIGVIFVTPIIVLIRMDNKMYWENIARNKAWDKAHPYVMTPDELHRFQVRNGI